MESSKLLDKDSSDNFEYVSNLFDSTRPRSVGENCTPKCELEPAFDLPSETPEMSLIPEPERLYCKGLLPKRSSAKNVEVERGSDSTFKEELEPYSTSARDVYKMAATYIKQESGINCVLCAGGTDDTFDIYCETTYGDVTLCSYICKVGNLNLEHRPCSKYACRSCFELLNVIERSELEYRKHRGLLLEIIRKNPALVELRKDNLGAPSPRSDHIACMKSEPCKNERIVSSEDDEPLACIKASRTNKSNMTEFCVEPKRLDEDRYFSSDDDFHWKLETEGESTTKRTNSMRRKKVKEEKGFENPSDILPVEFEELNTKEDCSAINNANNTTKLRNSKNEGDPDPSTCEKICNDLKCNKCNRMFKKRCYLERHSHCKKPYICEICGKGFKSPKLCQAHVLMHQGIADYKCIPCNKLFPTKVAFLRHDKIHNGVPNNQCDQCGKSFIHQSSLRMHKLAHSGVRKYTCDVCGLALLSNSMLTRHKLVHTGEKNFTCAVCFKRFARNSNMQTHMKTHTKDKPRPPTPPDVPGKRKKVFRCEMCPERFDRLFKLEIHLVDDHKVVLKKGRPKPRHTMKKLQRAQQAAATVVNAIATAIGAKRAGLISTANKTTTDPGSNPNEKVKEGPSSDAPVFKMSPHHQSMSPTAAYMSPTPSTAYTQESSEPVRTDYQDHHQIIKTAGVMIPPMAFNVGAEYLSRMPDYSQH